MPEVVIRDASLRIVSRSRNLQGILSRNRIHAVDRVDVWEGEAGDAQLGVTWADGSSCITDFTSFTVCVQWCASRRAFPAANVKRTSRMTTYLYRRGDGNDGNFPRHTVRLTESDCPFAVLRALVLNEFNLGPTRDHIASALCVEGEAGFGLQAWVHEGPEGEQAFGAAWLTAELEPVDDDPDAEFLADVLDAEAVADYTAQCERG